MTSLKRPTGEAEQSLQPKKLSKPNDECVCVLSGLPTAVEVDDILDWLQEPVPGLEESAIHLITDLKDDSIVTCEVVFSSAEEAQKVIQTKSGSRLATYPITITSKKKVMPSAPKKAEPPTVPVVSTTASVCSTSRSGLSPGDAAATGSKGVQCLVSGISARAEAADVADFLEDTIPEDDLSLVSDGATQKCYVVFPSAAEAEAMIAKKSGQILDGEAISVRLAPLNEEGLGVQSQMVSIPTPPPTATQPSASALLTIPKGSPSEPVTTLDQSTKPTVNPQADGSKSGESLPSENKAAPSPTHQLDQTTTATPSSNKPEAMAELPSQPSADAPKSIPSKPTLQLSPEDIPSVPMGNTPKPPTISVQGDQRYLIQSAHATPPIYQILVSADGLHFVTAAEDGQIKVWRTPDEDRIRLRSEASSSSSSNEPDQLCSIKAAAANLMALAASPDCKRVFSSGADRVISIWDFTLSSSDKGTSVRNWAVSTVLHCLALSVDGKHVLGGGADKAIRAWECSHRDVETGALEGTMKGHEGAIWDLVLSPDDTTAFSASADGSIKVWDWKAKKLLSTLSGHNQAVRSVAVAADNRLISGGADKTVRVWQWKDCKQVASAVKHTQAVVMVRTISSTPCFASASIDNTVRVWRIENCALVATFKGHVGVVRCVATVQNRFLVSGGQDNTLRFWGLPAVCTAVCSKQNDSNELTNPK